VEILFYRYGSICEPDIIESFTKLGFEVREETSEIFNKMLTPAQSVNIVSPRLIDGNFGFVFTINFFPWLSDLCNIINIPYICLIVDSPVLELYSNSIKNPCNRIFLFDRLLFEEFSSQNPKYIFHTPLSTNQRRNMAVCQNASSAIRTKFKSDISFIGSLYSEKCPFNRAVLPEYEAGYAKGLIESQLKVYGYNFIEDAISDSFVETFIKCTPNFYIFPDNCRENYKAVVAQQYISVKVAEQERLIALKMLSDNFNVDIYTGSDTSSMPGICNRGFAKSLEEMPIIFNQSKININITSKSIRSGLSLRIFDVLGCCGFLITNYQAEIPELFNIGEDLETYSSMEELHDKVSYYLAHDSKREAIARSGYEKVQKYHTYDIRLTQMLEMAFSI